MPDGKRRAHRGVGLPGGDLPGGVRVGIRRPHLDGRQVGSQPVPHLSRSRVPQPFFSVCAADQVIVHMAGRGTIEFRELEPDVSIRPFETITLNKAAA